MFLRSFITFLAISSLQASSYENATTTTNGSKNSFAVFIPILPECWCSCKPAQVPRNGSQFAEYVDKWKSEILVELLLDTDKLSASTRKKSSATDGRTSAVGVGSIGVVTLSVVFLTIACMDLTSLRIIGKLVRGSNA
ncbi:hypothetical protein BsWGS_08282 [Bradybaena similaris]